MSVTDFFLANLKSMESKAAVGLAAAATFSVSIAAEFQQPVSDAASRIVYNFGITNGAVIIQTP